MRDAAEAILFGLALGDALTRVIKPGRETMDSPSALAPYGDPTWLATAVTEGLLDAGLDADAETQRIAVAWRASPYTAPVGTVTLGYLYPTDDSHLHELAQRVNPHSSSPSERAASIAAAYAVRLALDGVPTTQYLPRIMGFVGDISEDFDAAIYRVGHAGAWTDEEAALGHIGQGGVAEEAVALALYCILRPPDDYVACVRRAASINGGSDSVACIAGGIMGARLGLDAIPAAWRARCENAPYLRDLAHRMALAVETER
jgi:ADP-ribosylglycohydrolase